VLRVPRPRAVPGGLDGSGLGESGLCVRGFCVRGFSPGKFGLNGLAVGEVFAIHDIWNNSGRKYSGAEAAFG
jgi:hypothetical protein